MKWSPALLKAVDKILVAFFTLFFVFGKRGFTVTWWLWHTRMLAERMSFLVCGLTFIYTNGFTFLIKFGVKHFLFCSRHTNVPFIYISAFANKNRNLAQRYPQWVNVAVELLAILRRICQVLGLNFGLWLIIFILKYSEKLFIPSSRILRGRALNQTAIAVFCIFSNLSFINHPHFRRYAVWATDSIFKKKKKYIFSIF
jgi:hypothetical protein